MPNQKAIRCASSECARPFKFAQFSNLDTTWERGKIVCPHCGAAMIGPSAFVYLSYQLTENEERRYDQANPQVPDLDPEPESSRSTK